METGHIIPHIEALIFASDKPLTPIDITELVNNAFGFMEDKITMDQVQTAIEGIVEKYLSEFYPFELKESGGGWQFLTKKEYHKTIAQLNGEKYLKRLSAAALETLAIVAYKQPITKSEIESIRGVNCDYSIQKLLEKELIVISGRNEELPGKPLIYNTSRSFMDYFGINSANDLPKLREVFNDSMAEPTMMNFRDNPEVSEDIQEDAPTSDGGQPEPSATGEEATAAESAPFFVVTPDGQLLLGPEEQDAATEAASGEPVNEEDQPATEGEKDGREEDQEDGDEKSDDDQKEEN